MSLFWFVSEVFQISHNSGFDTDEKEFEIAFYGENLD
jgi:hypothetical protein